MNSYSFLSVCIFAGVILIGIVAYYRISNKAIAFRMLELQLKTPIDQAIDGILQEFIESCFNDYIILNADLLNRNFINEDDEKKMVDDLVTVVSDRLSATMYKQLSVYYNEKAIPGIISNKIYELVLAYVVEANSSKDKSSEES